MPDGRKSTDLLLIFSAKGKESQFIQLRLTRCECKPQLTRIRCHWQRLGSFHKLRSGPQLLDLRQFTIEHLRCKSTAVDDARLPVARDYVLDPFDAVGSIQYVTPS